MALVEARNKRHHARVRSARSIRASFDESMHRYYHIDLPSTRHYVSSPRLIAVETRSAKELREHVERFARYFLRELGGSLQFEASESDSSRGYVPYKAFLVARESHYVGAACFRHRSDQDPAVPWLFTWLWIHPFSRRKGALSAVWSELNAQVGPFRLAPPVSIHMQAFLAKLAKRAA